MRRARITMNNYVIVAISVDIEQRKGDRACPAPRKDRPSPRDGGKEALLAQVCTWASDGRSCRQIAATCGVPNSTANAGKRREPIKRDSSYPYLWKCVCPPRSGNPRFLRGFQLGSHVLWWNSVVPSAVEHGGKRQQSAPIVPL